MESLNKTTIDFFRIITWLDSKIWEPSLSAEEWIFDTEVLNDATLSPSQKVLIHWLIYNVDRAKHAETLWKNKTKVYKKLVKDYYDKILIQNNINVDHILELWEKYDKSPKDKDYDKRKYISGLPSDKASNLKTLALLSNRNYKGDIIKYLLHEAKGNNDIEKNIAFRGFLLSYFFEFDEESREIRTINQEVKKKQDFDDYKKDKLLQSINETLRILENKELFDKVYGLWIKSGKYWNKRLWAALRDYVKYIKLSNEFKKGYNPVAKLNPEKIEFPGDTWNLRFYEIVKKILEDNVPGDYLKDKPPQKMIRRFYEKFSVQFREIDFYPERLDVSFIITPKLRCDKNEKVEKICKHVCVFGNSRGKKFCTYKYGICGVLFVHLGEIHKCDKDNCPIFLESESGPLCSLNKKR